jgi:hypothetical protein
MEAALRATARLFTTEVHARQKRPISKFYSMNGVLPLEPHMNKVINYFCQRLEEMFMDGLNAGKCCSLGE